MRSEDIKPLKVVAASIRREGEQNGPFSVKTEEGRHAVLPHVGRDGDGIEAQVVKKGLGVHPTGVTNVTTLGIGDGKMLVANVLYRALERDPSAWPEGFVEGEIGLVGDAEIAGGINNLAVELEHRIVVLEQVLGDFAQLAVEADAEEGFFLKNGGNKCIACHGANVRRGEM